MQKVFGLRVSVPNRFREPDIIYEVSKLYVVNCLYAMISKSWRKNKKKKNNQKESKMSFHLEMERPNNESGALTQK